MKIPYVSGACQRMNIIGSHTLAERVRGRINQGLGIKSGVLRLVRGGAPRLAPGVLGDPSCFADGSWVRVHDEATIRSLLDGRLRTRGLEFCPQQWESCGRSYRVLGSVRRLIDDGGVLRKVSRTVLLEGLDCGGESGTGGCGRHCPMMYRDEWLEPAPAPVTEPRAGSRQVARVRSLAEIEATLDIAGRRGGLMFMPEMARYAGMRLPVRRRLGKVFEHSRWLDTPAPVYILEGLRCAGEVLGSDGPCDRGCWLLWHADWLELDS